MRMLRLVRVQPLISTSAHLLNDVYLQPSCYFHVASSLFTASSALYQSIIHLLTHTPYILHQLHYNQLAAYFFKHPTTSRQINTPSRNSCKGCLQNYFAVFATTLKKLPDGPTKTIRNLPCSSIQLTLSNSSYSSIYFLHQLFQPLLLLLFIYLQTSSKYLTPPSLYCICPFSASLLESQVALLFSSFSISYALTNSAYLSLCLLDTSGWYYREYFLNAFLIYLVEAVGFTPNTSQSDA